MPPLFFLTFHDRTSISCLAVRLSALSARLFSLVLIFISPTTTHLFFLASPQAIYIFCLSLLFSALIASILALVGSQVHPIVEWVWDWVSAVIFIVQGRQFPGEDHQKFLIAWNEFWGIHLNWAMPRWWNTFWRIWGFS